MTTIDIDTPAGTIDALLSVPTGEGPWPGVVVVHDAVGYAPDNEAISQRIAQAGYMALTPNMYARGGRARCITRVFRELLTKRGRALDDILAARDHLLAMAECSGRVGIAGFCMGGGFALILSPRGFGASAPFYGTPLPAISATLSTGRARLWRVSAAATRWVWARPTDCAASPRQRESPRTSRSTRGRAQLRQQTSRPTADSDLGIRLQRDRDRGCVAPVFAFFGEHLGSGT
ncbi:dienelactone hydrolase family protein [Mycobacterium kansasii 824]|nr:dienelactone hydrolase family protein [Mycobacterium kansasii 824]